MTFRTLALTLIALVTSAVAPAAAQLGSLAQLARPRPFIQPSEAIVPIGMSQTFQLLDPSGTEIASDAWSVSDPAVASLEVREGRAILTGRAPGRIFLLNASGARSGEIRVQPRSEAVPESRWVLRPLEGRFTTLIWSATLMGMSTEAPNYSSEVPAYFFEDRGPQSSHVRAVRKDGVQVWMWPAAGSRESPRILSGDLTGGLIVALGTGADRTLVNIDVNGRERWRLPSSGLENRYINVTPLNVLYYVRNDATGARLVGLNGLTTEEVFSLPIDSGRETRRNLELRDGRIVCVPGAVSSSPSPLRGGQVITNAIGVTNLVYTEWSMIADAGACRAGAVIAPADVRLHVAERVVMVDIGQNLRATPTTVMAYQRDTNGGDTTLQVTTPFEGMIVGPDGTGNYLPLRTTVRGWPSTVETARDAFVYRLGPQTRTPLHRVAMPPSPEPRRPVLLLGDGNKVGYLSYGRTLLAFETDDGRERWRWTSSKTNIDAVGALQGDALILQEGSTYRIVDTGRAVSEHTDAFMLFVMRFLRDANEEEPR
jgi:outer membrane protein assembly factor BamB